MSNLSTATKTIQQREGGQAGLYILAGECLGDYDQVISLTPPPPGVKSSDKP